MQDKIIEVIEKYGQEHGWSRGYTKAVAPDLAIAIIQKLEEKE
jgi:hypothetical protein